MHLLNYSEVDGTYQVYAYINPQESGYMYLKVFQGGGQIRISDEQIETIHGIEYTGWSSDPQEQFFYNTEVQIGGWTLADNLVARFELWFVPDSGKPERKMIERYFNVKNLGW
jgi:hypothetical protein